MPDTCHSVTALLPPQDLCQKPTPKGKCTCWVSLWQFSYFEVVTSHIQINLSSGNTLMNKMSVSNARDSRNLTRNRFAHQDRERCDKRHAAFSATPFWAEQPTWDWDLNERHLLRRRDVSKQRERRYDAVNRVNYKSWTCDCRFSLRICFLA